MPKHDHASFLATIRANQPAATMMAQMAPKDIVSFAPGAIIVREKLSAGEKSPPDLLSVMVKRERGFSPASADWEFIAVSGDRTKVVHRETIGSCFNCHASQKNHDYVFSYEK